MASNRNGPSTAAPIQFEDILRGRWSTVHVVPSSLRIQWAQVSTAALQQFNSSPTLQSFARLCATTKVLLAAPKHGGKARADATERCIRARLNMWLGGRETEVCSQVIGNSRKLRPRFADKTEQSTMRRVQYLVNMGLVSKACQALCSRGTTEITPENLAKVQGLFPPKRECNLFSTNQPSRSHYQPRQSQIGGPEIREGVVTETNWLAS